MIARTDLNASSCMPVRMYNSTIKQLYSYASEITAKQARNARKKARKKARKISFSNAVI